MSDGGSLRDRAIASARWVTAGRVVCEVASFAALIALARLLTPAEVGNAAVAMVVFALATGFLAGSFGTPLVKAEELRDEQIEVAGLLSILSGIGLALLCLLAALALVPLLGRSPAEMLALASPCFVFSAISAVPLALYSRRLDFRRIMAIEVAASLAGSAAAVVLALLDAGSAAMVLGSVVTTAVAAAAAPLRSGARRPRWHAHEARDLLRFGLPASASAMFFTAVRNVDYALVSARLSAAQVGFYYRAYTLAVDYQLKISNVVVRVLFPVLSRTDNPAAFRAARGRVIRLHTVVLFPLLAILLVTAPELVPWLYGSAWEPAVVPAQILVGAGVATTIGTGIGPVMLAAGRPNALLINNVISFACFAVVVYVSAGYGLTATCIGVVVYRLVALCVSQYFLATRLLGIPLSHTLIVDPGPAAASAAALLAVAFPVSALLDGTPAAVSVLVTAAAGLAVYLAVLRALFRGAWEDIALVIGGALPKRLRRAAAVPG